MSRGLAAAAALGLAAMPDNPSPEPGYLWTETCSLAVDVPAGASVVRVAVVFDGSRCEMSANQD